MKSYKQLPQAVLSTPTIPPNDFSLKNLLNKHDTRCYTYIRKAEMRYFKNKPFQRDLTGYGLGDEDVRKVLDDVYEGRAIPLGSKLYKIRVAREGGGKSGGFRSVFFWKKDELIIFCLLFAKNEQDSLNAKDRQSLGVLVQGYDGLTENDIIRKIEENQLMEVNYEKKIN